MSTQKNNVLIPMHSSAFAVVKVATDSQKFASIRDFPFAISAVYPYQSAMLVHLPAYRPAQTKYLANHAQAAYIALKTNRVLHAGVSG